MQVLEFSDGTPATKSQCAKDVTCFLRFAAEPWHDERKKLGMKLITLFSIMAAGMMYFNRHIWTTIKYRKIFYVPKKKVQ